MTTRRLILCGLAVLLVLAALTVWYAGRQDPAPAHPEARRDPDPEKIDPSPEPTPPPNVDEEDKPSPEPAIEEKSVDLIGLVLDALGNRPVEGARVELITGGSLDGYAEISAEPHLAETVTDADGSFRFDAPPDRVVTVIVTKAGYTETRESMKLAAARDLTLRIAPGGIVRGTVTDPEGRPVPAAVVYVIPADAPEMLHLSPENTVSGTGGTWEALRAVAGADGGYEIRGLVLDGLYHLRGTGGSLAPSEDLEVRATLGEIVVTRILRLRRHGVVLIHVIGPDGKPVPTATGWIDWGKPIFPTKVALTRPGLFRLEGLTPGPHLLRIVDAGAPPVMEEFEAVAETTVEVTVRLESGVSVSGVVLDDRGEPVAGVNVEVRRPFGVEHRDLPESEGKAESDAEGKFRVDGLRPGPHALLPYAKDLEGIHLGPFEAPADDLEVKVIRRARVRGRIVLPSGSPPPAEFWIRHTTRPRNASIWGGTGRGWSGTRCRWSDGRFEVTVPACPLELLLCVEGCAPVRMPASPTPGGEVDLGDVPLDPGITLTGRITDRDGGLVAGASVTVAIGPLDTDPVASTATGDVTLAHLPAMKIEVTVKAEGFLDAEVPLDLTGGRPILVVTLSRGGLLQGSVVGADGRPVTGLDLHVCDPKHDHADGHCDYPSTDIKGRFTTRLHAGEYTVEVRRTRKLLLTVKTSLEEEETTELRIELPAR